MMVQQTNQKEKIMEFMEKLPEEYKENFRYTEKRIRG